LLNDLLDRERLIREKDQMIEAWKLDYNDLRHEKNLDIALLKIKLAKALKRSIKIPKIDEYVQERTQYNPWIDDRLYDLQTKFTDRFYYTYSVEDWGEILSLCYESTANAQEKWIHEIGDCDNWAETLHQIVMNATLRVKPRLHHQSAIALAWSWEGKHAYNAYFSTEGIHICEPQSGETVGLLGETDLPYKTQAILFIS
jgi:hypothetical protein